MKETGKDFNRVMSPRGFKPDKKENIIKVLCLHIERKKQVILA